MQQVETKQHGFWFRLPWTIIIVSIASEEQNWVCRIWTHLVVDPSIHQHHRRPTLLNYSVYGWCLIATRSSVTVQRVVDYFIQHHRYCIYCWFVRFPSARNRWSRPRNGRISVVSWSHEKVSKFLIKHFKLSRHWKMSSIIQFISEIPFHFAIISERSEIVTWFNC